MARQRISLETKPHVVELDGLPDRPGEIIELLFVPEVLSDQYIDAYAGMQESLNKLGLVSEEDLASGRVDPDKLREGSKVARAFLSEFMLDNSKELFAELQLPDRVIALMTHTVMEFYGERPTGSSNGSRPASSKAGPRSTGRSRSKAKTRAGGR